MKILDPAKQIFKLGQRDEHEVPDIQEPREYYSREPGLRNTSDNKLRQGKRPQRYGHSKFL